MDVENQEADESILVRATINFGGLHVGQLVRVDPRDPEIANYLAAKFLYPEIVGGEA